MLGLFQRAAKRPSVWLGGALIALALLALWLGAAGAELYVQRLSLPLMLAGVTVYFWGLPLLRWVAMPLFLLWLALPVPTIIFNKIAFPLQLFASRCAVSAMQGLDIPVVRLGNVIELLPQVLCLSGQELCPTPKPGARHKTWPRVAHRTTTYDAVRHKCWPS